MLVRRSARICQGATKKLQLVVQFNVFHWSCYVRFDELSDNVRQSVPGMVAYIRSPRATVFDSNIDVDLM